MSFERKEGYERESEFGQKVIKREKEQKGIPEDS